MFDLESILQEWKSGQCFQSLAKTHNTTEYHLKKYIKPRITDEDRDKQSHKHHKVCSLCNKRQEESLF
mgnify:CR=1 FL=1